MITLKKVKTKKELKAFVKFPFSLYKNNEYWVPPIINDELDSFDPAINPVFKEARADFFLAYKNGELVGRIAAIINWTEINVQKIKKMRFGWFDFIDDLTVSKTLLEKVKEIGLENNLEYMEGPVGFSNLDKVGVLTFGFDHIGTMITWYNYPYYKNHFEKLDFKIEKEYLENRFPFKNVKIDPLERISALIEKRYKVKGVNFKRTKDLLPYVDEMFDLFNICYASLPTFVPISDAQKEFLRKRYISFINPEYITFVFDENNKMIGFGINMPSFSKALQKANGKLFPFGIFHLLYAKKHSKDVISYLIGVHPNYQNKGINAIMFRDFQYVFEKLKIENYIRTPELADNTAIAGIMKKFGQVTHKKRCTFSKPL
ncbi:MAG: GTP cyclohydrolase [Flavobacteriaceae bacterium]|nr:GTP cyclohydrolase [Flavobacteriaceae bacterium]